MPEDETPKIKLDVQQRETTQESAELLSSPFPLHQRFDMHEINQVEIKPFLEVNRESTKNRNSARPGS